MPAPTVPEGEPAARAELVEAPAPSLPNGRAGQQDGATVSRPLQEGRVAGAQRVTVRVPAALRHRADDRAAIQVELAASQSGAVTVGEVLAALAAGYPGVHHAALDERGAVRRHVNVFVGAENIRFGAGLATPVPPGAEVWILPAVSGG